ncbi:MAG TPA: cobyric acid synthase, partial [Fibrobacteria bacterium]|nr:cobyric acid synthase [Fibrobacteria bacterium]
GLRLGMLAAAPALAARLRRALLPWSINAAAAAVAPRLYSEAAFLAESHRRIREGRESLAGALSGLPGLKVFPSAANFLYLKLPAPWTGERLQAALLRRGMMIRAYGGAASPEGAFCRVAVRLPGENAELVRAMAELLGGPVPAGASAPKSSAPSRARALMVLGTMSNSGKSTVAAALCRCAARRGFRVAPFKAQNMALNSHVTQEGGEIGRAQAVQARAAGVESHTDMNPVLLKPTSAGLMQVIVDGKAVGNFSARDYYTRKGEFRRKSQEAFDRLAARYDTVILEGAGSPAEINLRDEDFVNASMAEYAGARCVLVADIDRGGVFASILGTVRLLPRRHRELLAGIIINKFRGDSSLLSPGIAEIERLTGVPVLGVLPYLENLDWEEEDSLGLEARAPTASDPSLVDIAVVRVPYLSNYTDFRPLERLHGVSVRYVAKAYQVGNPDLLILPGSKNVRHDMEHLRRTGLARVLVAAAERRVPLLGICGGYQMLGRTLRDPYGLEGDPGETLGLGLLPLDTVLEREKELSRVEARNLALPFLPEDAALSGYEIHLGRTTVIGPGRPLLQTIRRNSEEAMEPSGFRSPDLSVFGCYLHGLFDSPGVAEALVHWLARRKGLDWSAP